MLCNVFIDYWNKKCTFFLLLGVTEIDMDQNPKHLKTDKYPTGLGMMDKKKT